MALKLCIAQLNFMVGDMAGQRAKDHRRGAHRPTPRAPAWCSRPSCPSAAMRPKTCSCGPAFIAACDDAVKTVARELAGLKGLHVVVGHPTGGDIRSKSVAVQRRFNAASVLSAKGEVLETYAKRELPNYQVFDERRYFTPGQGTCVFQVEGVNVGLLICEDAWFDEPALLAKEAGAELLAVINASPFHAGKGGERVARMADRARARGPAAGLCAPGGRAGRGGVRWRLLRRRTPTARWPAVRPGFQEDLFYVQAERGRTAVASRSAPTWRTSAAPRPTCGTRWCWACATTSARTAFPACCWACRAASTRRWCWPIAVDALGARQGARA